MPLEGGLYQWAKVGFSALMGVPFLAVARGTLPHYHCRTPINSILFVGAVVLALGLASPIGVGQQEAFQLLDNAAGIPYALPYSSCSRSRSSAYGGGGRREASRPPAQVPADQP